MVNVTNGHDPSGISSVVQQFPDQYGPGGMGSLTLWLAHAADEIPAWGTQPKERDIKLREFYKLEPMLAGAIFGTVSRYSTFEWKLVGPERQCNAVHRMLHNCEHGRGFLQFLVPVVKDYLTQDNMAWIEIVREDDSPISPVVQLNHLDAGRCWPTGRWEEPCIYQDLTGGLHTLKYYQVARLGEYPSPDERMRGYQECAVSRILMYAQKQRDITTYEREKFGGRNPATVHFVGGITKNRVDDTLKILQNQADNMGQLHYMLPPIITAVDQNAHISHEQVDLKGVPEGYDKAQDWKEYIVVLALGIGIDPQDIAPLPGGNLGSAQQSKVLEGKGQGKGPKLFMTNMMHMMNMHGILPKTVTYEYQDQDPAANEQATMMKWRRFQMYRLMAGTQTQEAILSPELIRQLMRDNGDLKQEYLDSLHEPDLTPLAEVMADDKTKSLWQRLRGQ